MNWPPLNPGELRDQISIQVLSTEQDSTGGTPDENLDASWSEYAACRARMSPTTGREVQEAGKQQGEVSVTFRMHWMYGVVENMRIVHGGTSKKFDIRAVLNEDGMNAVMRLLCRERN